MRQKKKTFFLCLKCAQLPLFYPAQVSADLIFTPENSFYESHQDECTSVNRDYTTRGKVYYRTSPEALLPSGSLADQTLTHISYMYTSSSGNQWGYFEDYDSDSTGWVPMDYMTIVYGSPEFRIDHNDEIDYESKEVLPSGTTFLLWSYPESGNYWGPLDLEDALTFDGVFEDTEGRLWGNCNYYHGNKDFWVCISDPANSEIPARGIPVDTAGQSKGTSSGFFTTPSQWMILVLPVVLVVILAVVLLRVFFRKKN